MRWKSIPEARVTSANDIEPGAAALWPGELFGTGRFWARDGDPSRQMTNTVAINVLQKVEADLCARIDNKDSVAPDRERCLNCGRRLCGTGKATAVNNPILLEMSNNIHQNARLQRFSRERRKEISRAQSQSSHVHMRCALDPSQAQDDPIVRGGDLRYLGG